MGIEWMHMVKVVTVVDFKYACALITPHWKVLRS